MQKLGVKIKPNTIVGQTSTVDELFEEGFDAIFVAQARVCPIS